MEDFLFEAALLLVGWTLEEYPVTREDADTEAVQLFRICAHSNSFFNASNHVYNQTILTRLIHIRIDKKFNNHKEKILLISLLNIKYINLLNTTCSIITRLVLIHEKIDCRYIGKLSVKLLLFVCNI